MNKKYEMINPAPALAADYIARGATLVPLYRIKALQDFGDVKKGDLGGLIEKEENLSHNDACWVYDNARIFGNARLSDNAKVKDNSVIRDRARVFGNAVVCGHSSIGDDAIIKGNSRIIDSPVEGNTRIEGNSTLKNSIAVKTGCLSMNAFIEGSDDWFTISNIGSRHSTTTFFKMRNELGQYEGVGVVTGCFEGSLDKFIIVIRETHSGNYYEKEYMKAIELAKLILRVEE